MKNLFKVLCMSLLLGLSQAAWADEIGHGDPDSAATPVETDDTGAEENGWLDRLLDWFDALGNE